MKWLALLALLSPAARAEECEGYKLALERDGIRVYSRKIDGSSVREQCATIRLEAPPSEVYALLLEAQRLPPTVQAERLSTDAAESVWYMVIDPGFISRRDYCVAIRSVKEQETYSISWHQVDCPLRRLDRMVTNTGSWRVTPLDGGRASAVRYHTHADPGGLVPSWLVNSATTRRIPEILGALRRGKVSQK